MLTPHGDDNTQRDVSMPTSIMLDAHTALSIAVRMPPRVRFLNHIAGAARCGQERAGAAATAERGAQGTPASEPASRGSGARETTEEGRTCPRAGAGNDAGTPEAATVAATVATAALPAATTTTTVRVPAAATAAATATAAAQATPSTPTATAVPSAPTAGSWKGCAAPEQGFAAGADTTARSCGKRVVGEHFTPAHWPRR